MNQEKKSVWVVWYDEGAWIEPTLARVFSSKALADSWVKPLAANRYLINEERLDDMSEPDPKSGT